MRKGVTFNEALIRAAETSGACSTIARGARAKPAGGVGGTGT